MKDKPGCLLGIIKAITGTTSNIEDQGSTDRAFPYALRDDFLSADELSLYSVMTGELGNDWVVCPKVGLGDLFHVVHGGDQSKLQTYLNKIQRKHVDFVICDRLTMTPKLLVELDDASHQKKNRQDRDEFVDGVCAAAEIAIVHIPSRGSGYSKSDIEELILPPLMSSATAAKPVVTPTTSPDERATVPACPECGNPMALRKAKKGANAGNEFYGCTSYPKCRGIVQIEGK